jgi:hypothetical protein
VTFRRQTYLTVTTMLMIAGLLGPVRILAGNNHNETGLPLYPKANTGTQYPPSNEHPAYLIYTAQSGDSLEVVEDWYRQALPQAKETKDDNQLTHGIVLTNGKDKVLVYQLGKSKGAVIELQKFVHDYAEDRARQIDGRRRLASWIVG